MSRRLRLDAVVVGGGVVGAACALALAQSGLDVVLLESREPARWHAAQRDLRVYAFAPDNAALLDRLGAWEAVRTARAQPYRHMRVWDAAGGGELAFDADAFARPELGWIVEHGLLVDRLWSALPAAGVRVQCPARVVAIEPHDDGAILRLEEGAALDARLVVAADGAESSVRSLLGIDVDLHDYAQKGVVAYVRSEQPHALTAWQRFLPTGPLALLPFADADASAEASGLAPGHCSSIVWTLPAAEAERVLALDPGSFGRELTAASGARLGNLQLDSARAAFPLRRQLASGYLRGRVLLVGDAAHVVHPLAGQGVNLGLRDVAALHALVRDAQARRADYAAEAGLRRWARTRRSENALSAHAFTAINRVFSNDGLATTLLRGPLLGVAGRLSPLAHALWRHAAGG